MLIYIDQNHHIIMNNFSTIVYEMIIEKYVTHLCPINVKGINMLIILKTLKIKTLFSCTSNKITMLNTIKIQNILTTHKLSLTIYYPYRTHS